MSIPLFGIDMFRIKVVVTHFPFLWLSCPHLFTISWNLCSRRQNLWLNETYLEVEVWSGFYPSICRADITCPPSMFYPSFIVFSHGFCGHSMLQIDQLCTYRGILIDKNLSWKHHIDHIIIKVSRTIGLIAKLRHFLPMHTLSMGSGL